MEQIEQRVQEESKRFRAALPDLLKYLRGRWVIYLNGRVEGVFDDEDSAYGAAAERFGLNAGFVIAAVVEPSPPSRIGASTVFAQP